MKRVFQIIAFYLFISSTLLYSQSLDSIFYPTNGEIQSLIKNLETNYPSIVKYLEIGNSKVGGYPIMCLKISDNVSQDEDEPSWIFTGMIHGSEQIGLRTLLELADELSKGYSIDSKITSWVNAYELYLVFSVNPWGYSHDSYGNSRLTGTRKNAPNNSNAIQSGVDLNRNYGFRWTKGGETDPLNSRYRGNTEFSENETQAIRDLYLLKKPLFGITFHQGNQPDGGQIMRPWSSSTIGVPPDIFRLVEYSQKYADWVYNSRTNGPFCMKNSSQVYILQDPDGLPCGANEGSQTFCSELCWEPEISTLGAYGQSSNYYYAAVGTIDITVEVSDRMFNESFMHSKMTSLSSRQQKVLEIAKEFSRNQQDAIKSWLDDFLYSSNPIKYAGPGITGLVKDSLGNPISAVVTVQGYNNNYVSDRTTIPSSGRFWKLLPIGNHYVEISAVGYKTQSFNISLNNNEPLHELNVTLKSDVINSVNNSNLVEDFSFSPVYPNPTNNSSIIQIRVKEAAQANITLHDLLGRKVKDIYHDYLLSDINNLIQIDFNDLSSGLYFLRASSKNFNIVKTVTLVK